MDEMVKEVLKSLDMGKSVAEFDSDLGRYFVETHTFRELANDKVDIVAGDKGTGKTALLRIFHDRYKTIGSLKDVELLSAYNPQGNPVFQGLAAKALLTEGDYTKIWKSYVLSLVGNWVLSQLEGVSNSSLDQLRALLDGLDLLEKSPAPANIFEKIINKVGALFKWKSASLEMSTDASGLPKFIPKIEFDNTNSSDKDPQDISIEHALRLLNNCLSEVDLSVWITFDRLDEAFQGYPEKEIPALRALLRSYLDFLEFPRLRLKLFLRRDLFRKVTEGGFVNLTHINARKIEIIWDEEDLLNLLCRRIRENRDFLSALQTGNQLSDVELFERVFPDQVDVGKRKPQTWKWIMRRIRDGNDIKPPRNLIDLISAAQQAQMRREDRDGRRLNEAEPIIESDALRKSLSLLSKNRVQDTLLAEAGRFSDMILKFRNGRSEHNLESLEDILQLRNGNLKSAITALVELGFLEETQQRYKIPSLYREGLSVKQGKAFEERVADPFEGDADDDDG